jgi:hypothetical protein
MSMTLQSPSDAQCAGVCTGPAVPAANGSACSCSNNARDTMPERHLCNLPQVWHLMLTRHIVCHAGSVASDQMKQGLCTCTACLHCSDLLIHSLRRVNVRLAQRIRASAGSHSVNG